MNNPFKYTRWDLVIPWVVIIAFGFFVWLVVIPDGLEARRLDERYQYITYEVYKKEYQSTLTYEEWKLLKRENLLRRE